MNPESSLTERNERGDSGDRADGEEEAEDRGEEEEDRGEEEEDRGEEEERTDDGIFSGVADDAGKEDREEAVCSEEADRRLSGSGPDGCGKTSGKADRELREPVIPYSGERPKPYFPGENRPLSWRRSFSSSGRPDEKRAPGTCLP